MAPVIFFSDLIDGPRSGWEGSSTKGAAVTIWGIGFGAIQGSSYVSVGGVQASEYPHWGNDSNNARGLQSVTFHLTSSMSTGLNNITITVNGSTSSTFTDTITGLTYPRQFYVRTTGSIYFVNNDGGDNGNDGTFATDQGGGVGPWATVSQGWPSANGSLSDGDLTYIKAGSGAYTPSGFAGRFDGDLGAQDAKTAVVGYPGEWPIIGDGTDNSNIGTREIGGPSGHFVVSRLIMKAGATCIHATGGNYRLIANRFEDNQLSAAAGVIGASPQWDTAIYGNVWKDCGYDNLKHAIYINSEEDDGTWKAHSSENIDVAFNDFNHYSNDYGTAYGGGVVEIKRQASFHFPTQNIWVHRNLFRNCTAADPVWNTDVNPSYIYNNIFYNNAHLGVATSKGSILTNNGSTVYILNNTLYEEGHATNNSGIHFVRIRGADTVFSKNNIYYAIDTGGGVPEIAVIETGESAAEYNSDYDLFYGNDVPSDEGSGTMTITNELTSDPQLTDPTSPTRDFNLQSGSPAIGAGTDLSSLFDTDYNGVVRSSFDLGALEFVAAPSPSGSVRKSITVGID